MTTDSDPAPGAGENLPRYQRVYTALRDDIVHGRIGVGEKLLESDLAKRFNVSRTPIREALHRLEKAGFIDLVPNVGATVSKVSLEELKEYAEMLVGLESFAVERAAESLLRPEIFDELMACQDRMRQSITNESLEQYEAANDRFHMLFLVSCRNTKITEQVLDLRRRLYLSSTEGRFPAMRIRHCINAHDAILDRIRAKDWPGAAQEMRAHIEDVCTSMFGSRALPVTG